MSTWGCVVACVVGKDEVVCSVAMVSYMNNLVGRLCMTGSNQQQCWCRSLWEKGAALVLISSIDITTPLTYLNSTLLTALCPHHPSRSLASSLARAP